MTSYADEIRKEIIIAEAGNYGFKPKYILINPKTFQALKYELSFYISVNFMDDNKDFKFMGVKLVRSEDIEESKFEAVFTKYNSEQ